MNVNYRLITAIWCIMVTWTSLCVAADKHPKFKNPQTVKINGLPAGSGGPPISTEEPFISRDGRFLFFNTGKAENHKDLHFAEFIHGQWVYRGQIGPGINTGKYAEANPTMDSRYNFFYIDSNNEQMVKTARFAVTGKLHDLKSFTGVPGREIKIFAQKFHGNMGVEVSADGTMIFFSRATWGMKGFKLGKLQGSDIFLTMKKGNKYVFDKVESERIMKNINTRNLEYAAAISTDGLELFFTRLDINDYKTGRIRSKIMRSTRESLTAPFSKPEMIDAIGGSDFVEGPAISKDGRELYYHKHDGKKFKLYKVTR